MRHRTSAKWCQLTDDQKASFGNGCGPAWMDKSDAGRWLKTRVFDWFHLASCRHHDFGYTKGGNVIDKLECDNKFFKAMLSDCKRQYAQGKATKAKICYVIAVLYYLAVLIGGWFSFHFGDQRTLQQILEIDQAQKAG